MAWLWTLVSCVVGIVGVGLVVYVFRPVGRRGEAERRRRHVLDRAMQDYDRRGGR